MIKIDETVPGGLYRGADGSWHDANGKPLPEPVVEPAPVPAELTVEPEQQALAEPLPEPVVEPAPKKGKPK